MNKYNAVAIIHITSANRFYNLIWIDSIDFSKYVILKEIFYYCYKIILRKKVNSTNVIGYMINEDNTSIILVTRGNKKMNLIKPTHNPIVRLLHSSSTEYLYYRYEFTKDINYEVVE